jgi:hypothetical protein
MAATVKEIYGGHGTRPIKLWTYSV